MNLIDVHILHLPNENKEWRSICDESLIGHPINIFHCDGIEGDIKRARYNAYQIGTAPYVSFVDPDDIVLPGAFHQCLETIQQHPEVCGVYTLSNMIDINGNIIKLIHPFREWSFGVAKNSPYTEIHQLVVMRREDVLSVFSKNYDTLHNDILCDFSVYMTMRLQRPWKAVDYVGYCWRIHPQGHHLSPKKQC